jgi:hypothetical protein
MTEQRRFVAVQHIRAPQVNRELRRHHPAINQRRDEPEMTL